MFPQWRKRLQGLVRDASNGLSAMPQKAKRMKRSVLWSALGVDENKIERLKSLASSARRLEELTNTPGWTDVLDAKLHYQALYDQRCKQPSLSDKDRFQAACEWAAVEGFFSELHNRIRRGREAAEEVQKLVS